LQRKAVISIKVSSLVWQQVLVQIVTLSHYKQDLSAIGNVTQPA